MKVRTALGWLVCWVLAPMALVSGLSLATLYRAQTEAHGQRALERVRALRIALDGELQATQRALRGVGERPMLRGAALVRTRELDDALAQLLRLNPMWSAALVVEPDGRESLRVTRPGVPGPPMSLDDATRARVLATRAPEVSALIGAPPAAFHTFVAVPVLEDDAVLRIVAVAVPHRAWRDFLAGFPVDPSAVLTLNDGGSRIIARTRDHERWAGRPARAEYWARTQRASEDFFDNTSLDGEPFLTAFSHLQTADWVLGTGMLRSAALVQVGRQSLVLGLLFALALVAAVVAAWRIGQGIAQALRDLAAASETAGERRGGGLPIDEVEEVRLRLVEALRDESAARAAAERASEDRQRFVSTLAHELRNPLAAIRNALALLRRPDVVEAVRVRAQGILDRQVDHLERLTNDLFDAARLGDDRLQLQPRRADLADLVRAAADVARTKSSYTNVILALELHAVAVDVDALRLQQVVTNLLDNAVKFSPPDSVVHVLVRRDGDEAVLEVADDGVGIEPELLPRVFDAYVKGSQPGAGSGGLGLGLHVVQRIVTMHGGRVEAHSAGRNRGARFVVRLPAQGPAPDAAAP